MTISAGVIFTYFSPCNTKLVPLPIISKSWHLHDILFISTFQIYYYIHYLPTALPLSTTVYLGRIDSLEHSE